MENKLINLKNVLKSQGLHKESKKIEHLIKVSQMAPRMIGPEGEDLEQYRTPSATSNTGNVTNLIGRTIKEFNSPISIRDIGNYQRGFDRFTPEEMSEKLVEAGVSREEPGYYDLIEIGLDIAGLIPGVGAIADVAAFVFAIWRGDVIDIVLGAIGLIPEAGTVLKNALKLINKIPYKYIEKYGAKTLENMDIIISFLKDSGFVEKVKRARAYIEIAKKMAEEKMDLKSDGSYEKGDDNNESYLPSTEGLSADPDQNLQASYPEQRSGDNALIYTNPDGSVIRIPLDTNGKYYKGSLLIDDIRALKRELHNAMMSGRIPLNDFSTARELKNKLSNII